MTWSQYRRSLETPQAETSATVTRSFLHMAETTAAQQTSTPTMATSETAPCTRPTGSSSAAAAAVDTDTDDAFTGPAPQWTTTPRRVPTPVEWHDIQQQQQRGEPDAYFYSGRFGHYGQATRPTPAVTTGPQARAATIFGTSSSSTNLQAAQLPMTPQINPTATMNRDRPTTRQIELIVDLAQRQGLDSSVLLQSLNKRSASALISQLLENR